MPSGLQLCIFMMFFLLLTTVSSALSPLIIHRFANANMNLETFFKSGYLQYPKTFIILNSASLVMSFLLPSLIFAYLAHPQASLYLGYRKPLKSNQVLSVIILAVGMLLAMMQSAQWIQRIDLGKWANDLQESRQDFENLFFQNKNAGSLIFSMLVVGLVPAICEETFFRGVIMRFLNTWFQKPWVSIVISAIIFATIHLSAYNFVPIVFMGILLAWVYFKTSSLWLNILLHFLFNASQVLIVYFAGNDQPVANKFNTSELIIFLSGSIITCGAIYLLQKNRTPLPDKWSVVERDSDMQNNFSLFNPDND